MVEKAVPDQVLQSHAGVRFEWGPRGAEHLEHSQGCLVVVDVLSFTTAVVVATGRKMAVLPYPLSAADAEDFATANDAVLALRRSEMSTERPWSLSPSALERAPWVARVVLPSPNGSAIASSATGTVVAACLRNARASASWVLEHRFGTCERPVLVVAAGERWPDGSLRPALEDALGAGAVLSWLRRFGCELSSEAVAMALLFEASDVQAALSSCGSARELESMGFGADVEMAAALDADDHVAVLRDGAFETDFLKGGLSPNPRGLNTTSELRW